MALSWAIVNLYNLFPALGRRYSNRNLSVLMSGSLGDPGANSRRDRTKTGTCGSFASPNLRLSAPVSPRTSGSLCLRQMSLAGVGVFGFGCPTQYPNQNPMQTVDSCFRAKLFPQLACRDQIRSIMRSFRGILSEIPFFRPARTFYCLLQVMVSKNNKFNTSKYVFRKIFKDITFENFAIPLNR